MSRWITFDRESRTAIAAATPFTPELHDGGNNDALGAALASAEDSVLLMPAADSERVLIVQIRHVAPVKPAERTPVYEAGGFLGLRDEPVYDSEPAPPKKWWQKILE